jgi:methylated-DNA-protein-cysteine methyltransferase-like protein
MNSFSQRVWEVATSIPAGRVITYGALARAAGGGMQSARSITSILSKAPNKTAIPFHRIVYSDGRVWLTDENKTQRLKLYKKEGIFINKNNKIENFEDVLIYDL